MMQTKCKHCGSNKVRLIDTEQLFIPDMSRYDTSSDNENQLKELYQWDEDIFATAGCDNCGKSFKVEGTIKWNI